MTRNSRPEGRPLTDTAQCTPWHTRRRRQTRREANRYFDHLEAKERCTASTDRRLEALEGELDRLRQLVSNR